MKSKKKKCETHGNDSVLLTAIQETDEKEWKKQINDERNARK